MKSTLTTLGLLVTAGTAFAHEGHGAQGTHWHAADAWGFMAGLAAAAALMWWRSRR